MIPLIAAGAGASVLGSWIQANAQQNIAESQLGYAERMRSDAMGFAKMTPAELSLLKSQTAAYHNYLQFQQSNLMAQGDLLKQYQMAQSDVMSGKTPGVLSPMEKQFEIDRQKLNSQMRAMGGSGMGGSSAGMQQRAFQEQAMGMARLNALQGLSGMGAQQAQVMNQGQGMTSDLAMALLGARNAIQNRQIAASNQIPVYQYAGAGSIGSATMGAGLAGLGNNAMQMGLMQHFAGQNPGANMNYNIGMGGGGGMPMGNDPYGGPWRLGGNYKF